MVISLHGGFINYGATFLMFMEYARNAVRMSALMGSSPFSFTPTILSVRGKTVQLTSRLSSWPTCAATPRMQVWRPCDAVETAVAWKAAVEYKNGPVS